MLTRTACLWALLVISAVACKATDSRPAGRPADTVLADLSASLDPLRAWFDEHADLPRALTLLSPT
jgi:hypothetical protein